MDSLTTAAAHALAGGDPLGALNFIALRDDAPALALRGIAMAQLGDLARAKLLLRRAARAFGPKETIARARCAVAEAEIALVSRDLSWPVKALETARATLQARGDRINAAHAHYLAIRRLILIGRLGEAERLLEGFDSSPLPPALRAAHELVVAGIALRHLRTKPARAALERAEQAARAARIRPLLAEVETLLASKTWIVDACRHVVRHAGTIVPLDSRPVLFSLARTLADAWPHDASREVLLARAFRAKHADESHRARLRVEIGRLRKALRPIASIDATAGGFVLAPLEARDVVVLARPDEEEHAAVLALLADGEAWSSSALALALAAS